jgi:membrane associated rhomboid family serine protease
MIIVPTEKKFDWKHAPTVLFVIVILNSLIYFLYQSTDDEKISKAVQLYNQSGYFKIEWPIYKQYLIKNNQSQQLSEYEEAIKTPIGEYQISYLVLSDSKFYDYIMLNAYEMINDRVIIEWKSLRLEIHQMINSSSVKSLGFVASDFKPLTLLSYQFLHGSVMHLIGNMFFLVICGFAVEAAIGHFRFLLFYLISGIVSGLFQMAIDVNSTVPLIGASGSISGVMAMYLGVFRFKKIEFFYWFFVFVGYFRAPALLILPFYIGKEVYDFLNADGSNVAFMAHAGGFVAGSVLMFVSYLFNKEMFNEEYIEENQSVNPKQERLALVYQAIEKFRFDTARLMLKEMIEEYGHEFDLILLKFHLSKYDCLDKHQEDIVDVFRSEKLSQSQIDKIEQIWKQYPEEQLLLEADDYYKIGWTFSNFGKLEHSEKIFTRLKNSQYNHKSLSEFALKLSLEFDKIQQLVKKESYLKLSEELK